MKKFTKKQLTLQAIACSVIATFVVAGIVSATTIGTNVSTAGTLEVTGISTLTGAVTAGGALTVTGATALNGGLAMNTNKFTVADTSGNTAIGGTLAVTGASTLTGLATLNGGLTSIATTTISGRIQGASPLKFDGTTANDANYLTIAITDPTAARTITLPNVSGTVYVTSGTDVAVADGGTGLSSYTAGDLIYASAATTLAKLASSTAATILMTDANGWPSWKAMSGDATIGATGALTIADNSVDGTDIALASQAAGDLAYYNGTDWVRLASSTNGLVLTLDSNGWPSWAAAIAALNNASAWTASQKLDEGLTVDTTAFIISGAGALTTTQAAALNGGIAVDTTQFTVSGTNGSVAIAAPNAMTTGTLLSAAGGTFSATGDVTGLSVDLSNATGNAHAVYGIDVKDLGTAGAGNEYGIYVEGTDWDYGLYVIDAAKIDGALTVGGTLALGANALTMTGDLAATGARVTKGWFTDVESTNMPTVGGVSLTSTFQGIDTDLTSLAALGSAADKMAYTTGANVWAEASITAAGRAILDDANAVAQLTTLGAAPLASPTFTGTVKKSVTAAVTGAGADQAGATALTTDLNYITAGANTTGVKLPAAAAGMDITILNSQATTMHLYSAATETVNDQAAGSGIVIDALTGTRCIAITTSVWKCNTVGAIDD